MAAAKTVLSQTMSINVEDGFDGEGTAQTKAHTYSGIKKDAGADELVKAGTEGRLKNGKSITACI